MTKVEEFFLSFSKLDPDFISAYRAILRFAAPILVVLLLLRCGKALLTFRREPEIWGWLTMADGTKIPITHWENVIGRHKSSDIRIDFPTVSKNHAVLTRYDDGSWSISDASSKEGTFVNGQRITICALEEEDQITIGGLNMQLVPISKRHEQRQAQLRTKAASAWDSVANLLMLTLLQILAVVAFLFHGAQGSQMSIVTGFGGIILCQWVLLGFYILIRRPSYEIETIAFFLCTMGMCAIATVKPSESTKQLIAMYLGVLTFLVIGWSLRDLERAKVVRYIASIAGVLFLLITLVFGEEQYGAKNWLKISGMSLQPSELSKVCFVFAGASALDRIMNKRNIIMFIGYSVLICGCLALMNDFGTALVFFCAFLIIAYLRSGSFGTLGLACTSLGFAGVVALRIAPHALRRFSIWRHVWEDPYALGYQQTRALMCIASGGLLGLGAGQGWLKKVFAADSDIAFATISEEWGLIIAVLMVVALTLFGLFAIRSAAVSRSSFYTIGACTAASILIIQTILNCLGTVDVLPLTGVTFPFLSNGGTSMIGAWGLLAFVKAADTRQNASFAVRQHNQGREEDA